jgi:hypothetical protein
MEIKTEILDTYTRRVNELLKRCNNQKYIILESWPVLRTGKYNTFIACLQRYVIQSISHRKALVARAFLAITSPLVTL